MQFCFNHTPESKDRPRFGAKGKVYDPQKKKAMAYKWEAALQKRSESSERPLESPICFGMKVHVPMPKSWSKKRKENSLHKPVESRPDVDNYLKLYMDILNGIAYTDDKFVSQGFFEKLWDYEGKVEINITPHEMSLQDEIEILGSGAVKMHYHLQQIFELATYYEKEFINEPSTVYLADSIKALCLDAGLDEIYGEGDI